MAASSAKTKQTPKLATGPKSPDHPPPGYDAPGKLELWLGELADENGAPGSARPSGTLPRQPGDPYEKRDTLRARAAAQRAAAVETGSTAQDSHRLWLDKKYAKRTAKRFAATRRSPQALPGPGRKAEEKKMNAKE